MSFLDHSMTFVKKYLLEIIVIIVILVGLWMNGFINFGSTEGIVSKQGKKSKKVKGAAAIAKAKATLVKLAKKSKAGSVKSIPPSGMAMTGGSSFSGSGSLLN